MLILVLFDVQYLQNVVFCFEKGWNDQNPSCSGSHHPIKKFLPEKLLIPPPLNAIWKILHLPFS